MRGQHARKFDGVVGFNDVALMALPKVKADARNRHYQQATVQKTKAIDNDLFKERHPSMPLVNESPNERVTRGKSPRFDAG